VREGDTGEGRGKKEPHLFLHKKLREIKVIISDNRRKITKRREKESEHHLFPDTFRGKRTIPREGGGARREDVPFFFSRFASGKACSGKIKNTEDVRGRKEEKGGLRLVFDSITL